MNLRSILVAAVGSLPASRLKNAALRVLGWSIGRGVRIGPCLLVGVDGADIGDNAKIGPFNVFRNLVRLELGEGAEVGQWNWITGARLLLQAGAPGVFHLGPQTAFTSRHYVDCTGGFFVGAYSSIGGERSTFISHSADWSTAEQTWRPVRIGEYCLLSSNIQVTPGTFVGDRIIVGMGATLSGRLEEPGLYVQPRAALVKRDLEGKYFSRELGAVTAVRAQP
ncbi:MAG: hypothetical protein ACSLFA_18615 [Mycobacterium sp.]